MVSYERRGGVAVITIERPSVRNAIDQATAVALRDAWERFEADAAAHVGVLAGAGEDFSAGADLEAMDRQDRPEGYLGFTRPRVEKPTIAAVQGHCVAGGLEMALWCDLRVAVASAVFGCFERRFGVPLVDGATQRRQRIVGLGRAVELIEPAGRSRRRRPGTGTSSTGSWTRARPSMPPSTSRRRSPASRSGPFEPTGPRSTTG